MAFIGWRWLYSVSTSFKFYSFNQTKCLALSLKDNQRRRLDNTPWSGNQHMVNRLASDLHFLVSGNMTPWLVVGVKRDEGSWHAHRHTHTPGDQRRLTRARRVNRLPPLLINGLTPLFELPQVWSYIWWCRRKGRPLLISQLKGPVWEI